MKKLLLLAAVAGGIYLWHKRSNTTEDENTTEIPSVKNPTLATQGRGSSPIPVVKTSFSSLPVTKKIITSAIKFPTIPSTKSVAGLPTVW